MTVHLPGIPDTEIVDMLSFEEGNPLGLPTMIPVIQVNWMDERQTCPLVLRYLAGESDGTPAEYQGCECYQSYGCTMAGRRDPKPCVFETTEYDPIWQKAMGWRLLESPDGSTCVTLVNSAVEIAEELGARIVGTVGVDP